MIKYQSAASKNNTAEMFRVLMPVIIVVILLMAGKKLIGSLFAPFGKLGENIGIADTEEEKKKIKQLEQNLNSINNTNSEKNPWDPNYWDLLKPQNGYQVALMKVEKMYQLAYQIYDAIGYIYDSPEDILGAIKQCKYKSQVSFLVLHFYKKYNTDLLAWLTDKLDTTGQKVILGQIVTYVNGLPSGIVK